MKLRLLEFDIDVSGEDVFSNNFTVCIASKSGIIRSFRFPKEISIAIIQNFNKRTYKYDQLKSGRTWLKIRVYCIIIHYLFKSLNLKDPIVLNICRDFQSNEEKIKNQLEYLLGKRLGLVLEKIRFGRLESDSHAHRFAFLVRTDEKRYQELKIRISLEDFEQFLRK